MDGDNHIQKSRGSYGNNILNMEIALTKYIQYLYNKLYLYIERLLNFTDIHSYQVSYIGHCWYTVTVCYCFSSNSSRSFT